MGAERRGRHFSNAGTGCINIQEEKFPMKNFSGLIFSLALLVAAHQAGAAGAVKIQGNWQWNTTIQSLTSFSRGNNLTATFKMWVEGTNGRDGGTGLVGPWWHGVIPTGTDTGYGYIWANP